MATFTGTAATNDNFLGDNVAGDLFLFAVANLTSGDTVNGQGGIDTLRLTTTGVLAANALNRVTNVERIELNAGGNTIALNNGPINDLAERRIAIVGGAGNDTVNAANVTGLNSVDITAGTGTDTLTGSTGDDIFRFAHNALTSADKIAAGSGTDQLILTTTGVVAATAFNQVTGVERVTLATGGNDITLINAMFASVNSTRVRIEGDAGNDVVRAGGLSAANKISTSSGAGNDMLIGGAGDDSFAFVVANLTKDDVIIGGGGFDTLGLSNPGALAADALAKMTLVEKIQFSNAGGGNSITLTNANYVGLAGGSIQIAILGAGGTNVINASTLSGGNSIDVTADGTQVQATGGAGADIFRFVFSSPNGDVIAGGLGEDRIILEAAGVVVAGALNTITGVERITLAIGGNDITLTDAMVGSATGGRVIIEGSGNGNDIIRAGGLGATRGIDTFSAGGMDMIIGGAGADNFNFTATFLTTNDTVNGGGGNDTLRLTTAGALAADAMSKVTLVETIQLNAGGNTITLVNTNVTGLAGATIKVIGDAGNDIVNAAALNGTYAVDITAGLGTETFTGGAGADIFRFDAAALTSVDKVTGGLGSDSLVIGTAGVVAATAFNQVAGVERIALAFGGNDITLTNAMVLSTNSRVRIEGNNGNDIVRANALSAINGIDTFSAGGQDTILGGAGADTFNFTAAFLTTNDSINGGAGSDRLVLTTAGTLATTALTNMALVETIQLNAGGNGITLVNANVTGLSGNIIKVIGDAGNDTVSAAALNATYAADITAGLGNETFTGGAGADIFRFDAVALTSADKVAGGLGSDSLVIGTAGLVAGTALNQVTGVERITLAFGGNDITLTNAMVGSATAGRVRIEGSSGSGNDIIRAGGLTGFNAIDTVSGGGQDNIIGGAHDDIFNFTAANLTKNDTVTGNLGNDTLVLTTAGALTADALQNVSMVENIQLSSGGNAITLTNPNVAGLVNNRIYVTGSAVNDTVNAASLAGYSVDIIAGIGNDTFTGGTDGDVFRFASDALTSTDIVTGGSGDDRIIFTSGGVVAVTAFDQVTGIERIVLSATGNDITLTDAMAASATGARVIVQGGNGDDQIRAGNLSSGQSIDVTAGAGADEIFGGGGNDRIDGGTGMDFINARGGDDRVTYNAEASFIQGGEQNNFGNGDVLVVNAAATVDLRNFDQVVGGGTTSEFESVDASGSIQSVNLTGSNQPTYSGGSFAGYLIGGSANDILQAGAISTQMRGDGGADSITGGAGHDTFIYYGDDFLFSETLDGAGGTDRIDAYDSMSFLGNTISNIEQLRAYNGSTITISASNAVGISSISGSPNNGTSELFQIVLTNGQTIDLSGVALAATGGGGSDMNDALTINGTAGNETVTLSNSVLTFNGYSGNDTVIAGANYGAGSRILGGNNDDRIDYRNGAALIDGGSGNDTLVLNASLTVDLRNAADQVTGGGTTTGFENVDASALLSAPGVVLTGRNDVVSRLTGSIAGDTLTAGNAGAVLDGGGNGDIINGGIGNDTIIFDISDLSMAGNGGIDTLKFAAPRAIVASDFAQVSGIEKLALADGANSIVFGDAILAATSANGLTVTGGTGADSLFVGTLTNGLITVALGAGNDSLDARAPSGTFPGFTGSLGTNDDVLTLFGSNGGSTAPTIDGGGGTDTLQFDYQFGFTGIMTAGQTGFEKVDLIDPSFGDSNFNYAFFANNTAGLVVTAVVQDKWNITLGNGGQEAYGNGLGDTLTGGTGEDRLEGGQGNDILDGGAGADTIIGGNQDDTIVFDASDSYVDGGDHFDTLTFKAFDNFSAAVSGGFIGIDHLDASLATDGVTIDLSVYGSSVIVTGSAYADSITVSDTTLNVNAGGGNDIITIAGSGAVSGTLDGQGDSDTYVFTFAPGSLVDVAFETGVDKLRFDGSSFGGLTNATFIESDTVNFDENVTATADFIIFNNGVSGEAAIEGFLPSHSLSIEHAFALDAAGDLYYIQGFDASPIAGFVSGSVAMGDFTFY